MTISRFIIMITMMTIVGSMIMTHVSLAHEIRFIGRDTSVGKVVEIDSIRVLNKTQFRDTTLILSNTLDLDGFTGIEESGIIDPSNFSISRNSPNPFENQAGFTIHLQAQKPLTISVFDLVGRKTASMTGEYGAGCHHFSLEGKGLAQGIYIIAATTGEETQSIKVLKMGRTTGQTITIVHQGQISDDHPSLNKTGSFNPGDTYRFIGYATEYINDTLDNQIPNGGECYKFDFRSIYGEFTDPRDGITYKTVQIGDQIWMAENLRTTRYRNKAEIPNITDSIQWSELTTGAYCNYDNDTSYVATYGRLYNWYAVMDSRGIAPRGWHIPDHAEWETLINYLGGRSKAGGKMKEAGTEHWEAPNQSATNSSGFTALPAGARIGEHPEFPGAYTGIGGIANFWSCTEHDDNNALGRFIDSFAAAILWCPCNKKIGCSVRCIKNQY
ncbi:MAG: T9SS type A sorting domain-containing protein [Candidatus Delongbacteria bacterium]|nr:T9SS type A sorting domain-containing protein [Candidatus Delongbacteria bacterium]